MQDSALILCFRELWGRLADGRPASELDLAQLEHMADWLQAKVDQYDQTPDELASLQPVFELAREGWELLLEGVLCLAGGDEELFLQARDLAEEGEETLQQLEEALVDSRDQRPVVEVVLG